MTAFVLECLPYLENSRVIVTECDRPEPAEEIQDGSVILVVVVHPVGSSDHNLIEAEQPQEM